MCVVCCTREQLCAKVLRAVARAFFLGHGIRFYSFISILVGCCRAPFLDITVVSPLLYPFWGMLPRARCSSPCRTCSTTRSSSPSFLRVAGWTSWWTSASRSAAVCAWFYRPACAFLASLSFLFLSRPSVPGSVYLCCCRARTEQGCQCPRSSPLSSVTIGSACSDAWRLAA